MDDESGAKVEAAHEWTGDAWQAWPTRMNKFVRGTGAMPSGSSARWPQRPDTATSAANAPAGSRRPIGQAARTPAEVGLGAMFHVIAGLLTAALIACPVGLRGQQPQCPPLDSLAPWARVNRAWSVESGRGWSNDSLRHILLTLREQDQTIRRDFGTRVGDTAYARQLTALDSTLASTFTGILDRYGLPTRSLVGAAGADAAMLIVQHSWSLQQRVLALVEALPPGEISPQALAMLEDRVLVHQGQPQRYGTQFEMGPDQLFHFAATNDLSGLEARRARMGLPPFTQYVCLMEEAGMHIDRQSLPRLGTP